MEAIDERDPYYRLPCDHYDGTEPTNPHLTDDDWVIWRMLVAARPFLACFGGRS